MGIESSRSTSNGERRQAVRTARRPRHRVHDLQVRQLQTFPGLRLFGVTLDSRAAGHGYLPSSRRCRWGGPDRGARCGAHPRRASDPALDQPRGGQGQPRPAGLSGVRPLLTAAGSSAARTDGGGDGGELPVRIAEASRPGRSSARAGCGADHRRDEPRRDRLLRPAPDGRVRPRRGYRDLKGG